MAEKYKRIAQFTPPQSVLDRIEFLEQTTTWDLSDDFYIQSLESASGTIVNCDYYPIRIQQLPPGWSPENLVEYFRRFTDQFITSGNGTSFAPYNHNGIDDYMLFHSGFESSLGALVSIDLNWIEKGSVILSEYYRTGPNPSTGTEKSRFKYTTMATPFDWNHPVAGNREFGIFKDPNNPNEYCFYTMGVDRASGPVYSLFENRILNGGHAVWSDIRNNMIEFINSNGGVAGAYTLGTDGTLQARPNYLEVQNYLFGHQTWDELRIALGC